MNFSMKQILVKMEIFSQPLIKISLIAATTEDFDKTHNNGNSEKRQHFCDYIDVSLR